jgi:uncharacterized membrane protein (UPF0136 family)
MTGKVLRIVGIVLLGVTAVITLLGGVGTTCVALDASKYDSMAPLANYQWLYVFYVLSGIVIGALGIWATRLLVKGRANAYRLALIALIAGLAVGILHMATSRALRGASMPVDFIVYATALSLVVFLLFRIPGVWNQVKFTEQDEDVSGFGTGIAMIVAGIIILTVHLWAGPTHVINGINYAAVWDTQLTIVGWAATLLGGGDVGANLLTSFSGLSVGRLCRHYRRLSH